MNKTEENKYTMYCAVNALLKSKESVYADMKALTEAAKRLDGFIANIGVKSTEVDAAVQGKTDTKALAEDSLVLGLLSVGGALWAYGSEKEDQEMLARNDLNDSALRRMRDTELLEKGKAIHKEATVEMAGLADYAIDQATLDDLNTRINAFGNALGSRESSVAERSGARTALTRLFNQTDNLLNRIDNMMQRFREKATQFYNEYSTARLIKDVGIRHRPEEPPPDSGDKK